MKYSIERFQGMGRKYLESSTIITSQTVTDSNNNVPTTPGVIISKSKKKNIASIISPNYYKQDQIFHNTPIFYRTRSGSKSKGRYKKPISNENLPFIEKNPDVKRLFGEKGKSKICNNSRDSSVEISRSSLESKYVTISSSSEVPSSSEISCPNTYTKEAIAELEHPVLNRVQSSSSDTLLYAENGGHSVKIENIIQFRGNEYLEKGKLDQMVFSKNAIRRHTWSSFTNEELSTCNPRFMIMSSFDKENLDSLKSSPDVSPFKRNLGSSLSSNVFHSIESVDSRLSVKDETMISTPKRRSVSFSSNDTDSHDSEHSDSVRGFGKGSDVSSDCTKSNSKITKKCSLLEDELSEASEDKTKNNSEFLSSRVRSTRKKVIFTSDSSGEKPILGILSPTNNSNSECNSKRKNLNPRKGVSHKPTSTSIQYKKKSKANSKVKSNKESRVKSKEKPKEKQVRSKSGCWTCRVRRKKCPEQFSSNCTLCKSLGLACLGYSVKKPVIIASPKGLKNYLSLTKDIILKYKNSSKKKDKFSKGSRNMEPLLTDIYNENDGVVSSEPENSVTSFNSHNNQYEDNDQEFQVAIIRTFDSTGHERKLILRVIWSSGFIRRIARAQCSHKGLNNDQLFQKLKLLL